MLPRPRIVSAAPVAMRASVCVLLAALTLAGCGVRGPLTMPQQPPRPTPPSVPDPGMQSLPGDPATPTPPTR
ncbi:hypothetical protein MW7_003820 [Imbroritus primus]|uniref:Uncharacterized protein n=1 Tax=Imbroritus primus TaxID=3058603 RepID=A0ACD3SSQ6_9BURK|nr:hypothetical protein MW7_003820 [Burkholderiaceae bacterium PBA]